MTQPDPVKNNLPAMWDLVIEDMKERDRIGVETYKTRLQPFNGRSFLRDISEELLDTIVYIKGLEEEQKVLNSMATEILNLIKEKECLNKKELEQILIFLNLFLNKKNV